MISMENVARTLRILWKVIENYRQKSLKNKQEIFPFSMQGQWNIFKIHELETEPY